MISVAMIVLNEEQLIARCIKALSWADEIVIVDGGSSDKTVDIIKKLKSLYEVRLYQKAFTGHFGDQKNFAISLTSGDWIFIVDADEIMEPGLISELKSIAVDNNMYDAVAIPRKNFINGIQTTAYPDYQFRFFRAFCRYIYPVHEELIGHRSLYFAKHHIIHHKTNEKQKMQNDYYGHNRKTLTRFYRERHEEWG